jgi:hypothetical protein
MGETLESKIEALFKKLEQRLHSILDTSKHVSVTKAIDDVHAEAQAAIAEHTDPAPTPDEAATLADPTPSNNDAQ